jgi:hypothetical protein
VKIMIELTVNPELHTADFTLPEGCPLCSGQLAIRVSGETRAAKSYCATCHWIGSPDVQIEKQGISLGINASLQA